MFFWKLQNFICGAAVFFLTVIVVTNVVSIDDVNTGSVFETFRGWAGKIIIVTKISKTLIKCYFYFSCIGYSETIVKYATHLLPWILKYQTNKSSYSKVLLLKHWWSFKTWVTNKLVYQRNLKNIFLWSHKSFFFLYSTCLMDSRMMLSIGRIIKSCFLKLTSFNKKGVQIISLFGYCNQIQCIAWPKAIPLRTLHCI